MKPVVYVSGIHSQWEMNYEVTFRAKLWEP